jgi:hypothetical protein
MLVVGPFLPRSHHPLPNQTREEEAADGADTFNLEALAEAARARAAVEAALAAFPAPSLEEEGEVCM